jgi:hypothetical protein
MNKKRYMRYLIFAFLVSLFLAGQAIAGVPAIATFDLYETDNGSQTGTPAEMTQPIDISAGGSLLGQFYVVLTETSDTSNHQLANWSDVLHFVGGNLDSGSSTVQLFSDPAFASLPISDIMTNGSFISEVTQSSFELIQSINSVRTFDANFNVHSDTEGGDIDRVVPEPSTFLLLGAGLAGVGLMRRKFKK